MNEHETHHQDIAVPASATKRWKVLQDIWRQVIIARDWFEAKLTVMNPVIEAKSVSLTKYKKVPSGKNLQVF